MTFEFFSYINNLNGQDGVCTWNYVWITNMNEIQGTITFRKINSNKDISEEEFMMNGNIFLEQLMKHHMLYVYNPEALRGSTFVKCYIVDRTLCLRRQEEEAHVFSEKYSADNEERTFNYVFIIDYHEPTSTKHKYSFNLGDFLGYYMKKDRDIEKTFNLIMKKIRKKVKSIPELYCLTPKEQTWLEKAVEKELNYLVYEVLGAWGN